MGLRDTYAYAIQQSKGKFHGSAEERDGKLHFKGTVATEAEKNEIWTAIKTIPTWKNDVVADIQVTGGPAASAKATTSGGTSATPYTTTISARRWTRSSNCFSRSPPKLSGCSVHR